MVFPVILDLIPVLFISDSISNFSGFPETLYLIPVVFPVIADFVVATDGGHKMCHGHRDDHRWG